MILIKPTTQRGFTLLEMLVSISLFVIMAAMAYSMLSQSIKSSEAVKFNNQQVGNLQFGLSVIEMDFIQLANRPIRNEFGDIEPALILKDDKITFTRAGWDNILNRKRSNLQRVEYEYKDQNLIRRYWLVLDKTIQQEAIETVLIKGITHLDWNLYDTNNKKHNEWPPLSNQSQFSGNTTQLKRLDLELELVGWGEITQLIELVGFSS